RAAKRIPAHPGANGFLESGGPRRRPAAPCSGPARSGSSAGPWIHLDTLDTLDTDDRPLRGLARHGRAGAAWSWTGARGRRTATARQEEEGQQQHDEGPVRRRVRALEHEHRLSSVQHGTTASSFLLTFAPARSERKRIILLAPADLVERTKSRWGR